MVSDTPEKDVPSQETKGGVKKRVVRKHERLYTPTNRVIVQQLEKLSGEKKTNVSPKCRKLLAQINYAMLQRYIKTQRDTLIEVELNTVNASDLLLILKSKMRLADYEALEDRFNKAKNLIESNKS